jgi:hypothetical protein
MQHRKTIGLNTSALSLALLAACSIDDVDLGGSSSVEQNLEVGARCVDSTLIEGDVFIATREELEALRGCEAIRGDFTLMVYEGTELTPLASLREVSGAILLGASARPIPDEILQNPMGNDLIEATAAQEAEAARSAEIVQAGWLESLHGLEALERAGQIVLLGIAAPDLAAFESLRSLSDHPVLTESGFLWIIDAKNLVDLRGLEGVAGIRRLKLESNPSLQSLDGVELSEQIDSVELGNNPSLTDLTALSSVSSMRGLAITNSGMENLDALANLSFTDSLTLIENPELENVDGLTHLSFAQSMIFMSNPKLESIPEFGLLSGPIEQFWAVDNDALRSVSLSFPNFATTTLLGTVRRFSGDRPPSQPDRPEIESGFAWFDISDNPQLESLTVGGNLTSALVLEVNRNPALSGIDLGTLRSLNVLSIYGNAALTGVGLGAIQTINFLSVIDNPQLVTEELRSVRTFDTVTSGNADDPVE